MIKNNPKHGAISAERHGIPKFAVVEVSIARFTNDGPKSFWKHILSGTIFKTWIRATIAVLLLFVVAAKFTSTLVVTDLRESRAGSFDQSVSFRFTYESLKTSVSTPLPLIGSAYDYWVNKPSSSEIFAEYWKPGKSGEDIDDTGPTVIALLPIPLQSEREILKSFKGMARVIDTRVYSTGFRCPILDAPDYFPGQQKWILSSVTGGVALTPRLTNAPFFEDSDLIRGNAWLLIDTGSMHESESVSPERWTSNSTWDRLNSAGSGPWLRQWSRATAADGKTETDYQLQMTLCYSNRGASDIEHLNITASTTSDHTEPVFRYDANTNQYDTSEVRNQLGAAGRKGERNNTERAILTISEHDMNASLAAIQGKALIPPYINNLTGDWLQKFLTLPGGKDLELCPLCSPDLILFQIADSLVSQLFTDVFNIIDSPALAIQAFNTPLYRLTYYGHISAFALATDNTTITRIRPCSGTRETMGADSSADHHRWQLASLSHYYRNIPGSN
ncbi:uncharacterized protein NECHADRAFT_81025 [Fusarium vanettenii 77-13-4]|uniref:Uncharacterized protein n=1 Tax=Fusarium vanettenii (strain ATCC MYA-4622 / CBS 123669 / FGSC 9596 / NRRL 45880 / 77-13-4) TaxID=660122 RepID=C7ZGJ7_FUSV7|nr:uncharacterized protein NECHADRAFT_81025 [Fusarium vanettenii 77-13-4]EEU36903.1 predicted protein [Fusarium vanettenii 77-13-4]